MNPRSLLSILAGLLISSPVWAQLTNIGGADYIFYTPYTFVTLAGQVGVNGFANGNGTNAIFWSPMGVAVDSLGNVFVGDHENYCIRKITPAGDVTVFAGQSGSSGSVDGTGTAARFGKPSGLAIDGSNRLFVTDDKHTIRMVTPGAVVTTIAGLATFNGSADGTNSDARFDLPTAVTVDASGNLFVTEYHNNRPRKITPNGTNWVVTTIPSDNYGGVNTYPAGIAVDSDGLIYQGNHDYDIKANAPDGTLTCVLGGATTLPTTDPISSAQGLYMDHLNNLYVANAFDGTIVLLPPPHSRTNLFPAGLLAGLRNPGGTGRFSDGTGTSALFSNPSAIAVDGAGTIFVADTGNSVIRKGYLIVPGVANSWTGASGKWENGANWSRGIAPSLADSSDTIGNAGNNTVTIDAATSANAPGSLQINNLDLTANTFLLDHTSLTVQNLVRLGNGTNATVTTKGGFSTNKLKVNGGTVQVLPGPQPAFEDPTLHNRIVAGYLRDGEVDLLSGSVITPELLLGVTAGKTGTLTMSGGSLLVQSNLVVGDCASGALGVPTLSGGMLLVSNATHSAVLNVRDGTFTMSGGTLVADTIVLTNSCGHFVSTGGTIHYRQLVVPPDAPALRLAITRNAQTSTVTLSWPSIYIGYALEQNAGFDPANWTPVNASLSDDGTNRSATLPATPVTQFYRLKQQ